MRVWPEFMAIIDEWRRAQPEIPPVSEAIHRLVATGLGANESADGLRSRCQWATDRGMSVHAIIRFIIFGHPIVDTIAMSDDEIIGDKTLAVFAALLTTGEWLTIDYDTNRWSLSPDAPPGKYSSMIRCASGARPRIPFPEEIPGSLGTKFLPKKDTDKP